MKREDVEALLHDIGLTADEHKCQPADVAFEVEGDTLAALCRAWLALDGGLRVYVGRVYDCDAGEDRGEITRTLPESMIGFVRIVPTPNPTEGEDHG